MCNNDNELILLLYKFVELFMDIDLLNVFKLVLHFTSKLFDREFHMTEAVVSKGFCHNQHQRSSTVLGG